MGDFFEKPPETPSLAAYTPPGVSAGMDSFAAQLDYLPQLNQVATGIMAPINQAYADQFFATVPSLQGNIGEVEKYGKQLMTGELPTDVASQVQRSSAYQALVGGGDPAAQFNNARTARNLGLTSLDMQNRGAGLLSNVAQIQTQLGARTNPLVIDPSRFLMSPQQLQQREDMSYAQNYDINQQNTMIDFYNDQMKSPFDQLLNNTVASVVSMPFNFVSDAANVVSHAPSMAAGFFAGAFGGPGGASGAMAALNQDGGQASTYAGPQYGGQGMTPMYGAQPATYAGPAQGGGSGGGMGGILSTVFGG